MACGLSPAVWTCPQHSPKSSHMPTLMPMLPFRFCEYRCSVSLIALEAKATGFHSGGVCCCRRTAPNPYADASAEPLREASR